MKKQDRAETLAEIIANVLLFAPGGVGVDHLRNGLGADKVSFDAACMALYRTRRASMDQHDWPAQVEATPWLKNALVADGRGNYYTVIALREQ
jgi:hypothetical protein